MHRQQSVPPSEFVRQLQHEAELVQGAESGGAPPASSAQPEDEGALQAAAARLDLRGGVRYWTDYLKVGLCVTAS